MELFFSPLACSMSTRIALAEAGAEATLMEVDPHTKRAIQSDALRRCGIVICWGCCHWRQRRVAGRGLSSRRPSRR